MAWTHGFCLASPFLSSYSKSGHDIVWPVKCLLQQWHTLLIKLDCSQHQTICLPTQLQAILVPAKHAIANE